MLTFCPRYWNVRDTHEVLFGVSATPAAAILDRVTYGVAYGLSHVRNCDKVEILRKFGYWQYKSDHSENQVLNPIIFIVSLSLHCSEV